MIDKIDIKLFADDTKTYTLFVVENTDENVDAVTDSGYELTQRVQSVNLNDLSAASRR